MRKREKIMLERIEYVGRRTHPPSLWFCDRGLGMVMEDDNARYVIVGLDGEERGVSYLSHAIDQEKMVDLPKQFVAILKMIAFPEVI